MKNPNLIVRSSYTFFKSIIKIDDIINFALENNYENVSLVDKNVMYGTYDFYQKAIKNNLKPIVGLEIEYEKINGIIFLAKNRDGYYELVKLSSQINLEHEFNIDEYLNSKNLISLKKDNFPISKMVFESQIESLNSFREIGNLEKINNIDHMYLHEEFKYKFGLEKISEVEEIINEIDLVIDKENVLSQLPSFFEEKNKAIDNAKYFENKIKNKFSLFIKDKTLTKKEYDIYLDRLKYEVKIIKEMKFESYFLIVSDIVEWSKSNDIKVGPGRGSAAGSFVSFLLNITEINPIEYGLFFERFLNPERISMPDIDIDFEDERREEIIKYIVDKYGKEYVSSIITFQTLRAKLSFRDVSRIKGLNTSIVNEITKMIPENYTLQQAYEKSKNFRYKIEEDELNREIYKIALDLEGLPRQFSTHAAGIVISNNKIINHVPVQNGYSDYIYQTQYSMNFLEDNGLLKIDILGLRNLHFLKEIISKINNNHKIISLNNIPFNDKEAFKILDSGYTNGIFQLESPGMKKILKEMNVDSFDDIVATTSLFRPGPIKQIPTFIKRKNKQDDITYLVSELEPILKPTFGIIVYQEQIMKIVQVFSDFSLAKADILRRAIGKKDTELISSLKEEFINGAISKGRKIEDAKKIYDLIFEFSDYGFNKSHAVSYSIISYQLAYLKAHYKIEFIWALLNSVIGNKDKTYKYILEAQDLSVIVLPPSINVSTNEYKIVENEIVLPFNSISGIGDIVANEIKFEREKNGNFKSFFDFYRRMQDKKLSKLNIEYLIKSGVFDLFTNNRNTLLGNLDRLQDYMDLIRIEKDNKVIYDENIIKQSFEYEVLEKKDYFKFEVEFLGFSFEGTDLKRKIMKLKKTINFIDVKDIKWKQDNKVNLVGVVSSFRELKTKTNSLMAFFTLDDGSNKVSITVWPGSYSKFKDVLTKGSIVFVKGSVDTKRSDTIILELVEKIEEK